MFAVLALLSFALPDPTPGYPPASDVWRFPPRAVVSEARYANGRFEKYLTEERNLWHAGWQPLFDEVTSETKQLYQIWDALDDAQINVLYHNDPQRCRFHLARLRSLIGDEAYYSATLPPAVPVWRFREMR